jgi:hypothetical protein
MIAKDYMFGARSLLVDTSVEKCCGKVVKATVVLMRQRVPTWQQAAEPPSLPLTLREWGADAAQLFTDGSWTRTTKLDHLMTGVNDSRAAAAVVKRCHDGTYAAIRIEPNGIQHASAHTLELTGILVGAMVSAGAVQVHTDCASAK